MRTARWISGCPLGITSTHFYLAAKSHLTLTKSAQGSANIPSGGGGYGSVAIVFDEPPSFPGRHGGGDIAEIPRCERPVGGGGASRGGSRGGVQGGSQRTAVYFSWQDAVAAWRVGRRREVCTYATNRRGCGATATSPLRTSKGQLKARVTF